MSTNLTNTELKTMVGTMRDGWRKPLPGRVVQLSVRGESVTPVEVLSRLEAFFDLLDGPDKARKALAAAVAKRTELEGPEWKFFDDLCTVVVQQFGAEQASKQFGVGLPQEPASPSVETTVLANDQRQKTRKARGIMGSKQRLALGGEPKARVVIIDPSTASEVPPPTPASEVPQLPPHAE